MRAERLGRIMQIQAAGISEGVKAAAFQNVNVKTSEEEKTGGVEKAQRERQGHSGVQRTGVENAIGLYQSDSVVQEAVARRIAEIKSKLEQLVNGSSGLELLGMKQEGYSLNADDVEKIETVIDQIQVKLAAYCDSYQPSLPVDSEAAAEILGNPVLAGAVTQSLQEYGVPATEDNLKEVKEAVAMAQTVETPDRKQAAYMADGGQEPTIENLYRTEHTPAPDRGSRPLTEEEWRQLKTQAEKILTEAGMDTAEENLDTARWMIEQGIPMNTEMLRAFSGILSVDGDMSVEEIVDTIAQAMAKGKSAYDALMTGEGYTEERVQEAFREAMTEAETSSVETSAESAQPEEAERQTASGLEELTRYRRLEELRLMMTTEAGLALLKKGIEIETLSLSELVEALKQQEQEYYKALYACDGLEANAEKLAGVQEVSRTVEALKTFPSYVVGMMAESQGVQAVTVQATYETGLPVKAALDAAHTVYDALMTAPNREYGDSLSKAFQNIDELLADMDRETTPGNRRVIKILAYNQMELNEQNMQAVTELDREYQYLLKNLTPRVTMYMIENQINPLDMELHELNDRIEEIREEIGPESAETYSEFLWKLEKKTDLPKEDRDAYIGLYRLLNQVDRTGEAAIGALVGQEREVTLEHLLSAVRSRRAKGMNISVDDEFGVLTELIPKGISITEQLQGFMSTMQEQNGAYEEEQKQRMQQLARENETLKLLAQAEEPVSLNNLEAAHTLAYEEQAFLQRVQESGKKQGRSWQERLESKESMKAAYEELETETQELLTEAVQNAGNGREVIEELRLFHHTVRLTGSLASFEDYHMPVEIDGKTCAVHVKLVHKDGETGRAEISMELPGTGRLRADFRVNGDSVSAFVMADTGEAMDWVKAAGAYFNRMQEEGGEAQAELTYGDSGRLPEVSDARTENTASTEALYGISRKFITAVIRTGNGNGK